MNTQEKKTVRIDRAKWRFGGNDKNGTEGITALLCNPSGKMCCLGFVSVDYGVPLSDIRGVAMPRDVGDATLLLNCKLVIEDMHYHHINSDFSNQASDINDERNLTNEEREQELIDLCERHNMPFVFEFVGEYSQSTENNHE